MRNKGIAIIKQLVIAILIWPPVFQQDTFANGVVSPEEEERIIAEEIAAGRMTDGTISFTVTLPVQSDWCLQIVNVNGRKIREYTHSGTV